MAVPPAQLLERMVQQKVALRLKDGRELVGRLVAADEHMNVVLDEAEEVQSDSRRRLGRVVLRGSNVVSLNAPGGASAPSRG